MHSLWIVPANGKVNVCTSLLHQNTSELRDTHQICVDLRTALRLNDNAHSRTVKELLDGKKPDVHLMPTGPDGSPDTTTMASFAENNGKRVCP